MTLGPDKLWLIPFLPLIAAGVLSVSSSRAFAGIAAIGAMAISCLLSLLAFGGTLGAHGPQYFNFEWLQFGTTSLRLGFVLDPLSAAMLVMVTFVGLLIFIYSTGYMAHDENYKQFFCFLSLFAAGMLGVVIANSLLLLFMCWEIVGLASYLLIGFWFFKPSAAAAAKKAFITTRIGDIGFFLGMVWLYSQTGTLLFYDNGKGCLENDTLNLLVTRGTILGVGATTAISLLIFCGAAGKSGQVPLHVWLPDAMEGPTPVSALIHAATMVAAGVFLVARVYPLMDADVSNLPGISSSLTVVTWIGAITAIFAASIAVAQNDIKRILAYSTVSQLGYMMMGLGVGGVFVGMFHLLTHAFFKALLFLGAGSVIHGSHEEQDIRKMGGLRHAMPVTFATYAVGMMALAGVPVFFSGFWSKDEILHSAVHWPFSKTPFLLGLIGAFLTAFYMTRQMMYVFFGKSRAHHHAHESPRVMTSPLVTLAVCSILIGFLGTPVWNWLEGYLTGEPVHGGIGRLFSADFLGLAVLSTLIVGAGIATGWYLYARTAEIDILQTRFPELYNALRNRYWIDEAYDASIIRLNRWIAISIARAEVLIFSAVGWVAGLVAVGFGWISRVFDQFVIDLGFDQTCHGLQTGADRARALQHGRVQNYIQSIAMTVVILVLVLFMWGCKGS
jgi:NADH-quinone oxidoreductase subunit L